MRPSLLALAALAVPALALTDIPSQLRLLSDISAPYALAGNLIPDTLSKRLNGIKLSSLPAALQRAVLWDAGLVRVGSSDSSSESSASSAGKTATYFQVYVPCGRTMSDIFLPKLIAVDNSCKTQVCNAAAVNFLSEDCPLATLEQESLCAFGGSLTAAVETYTYTPWSQDGQIDNSFDPVVVHKRGTGKNASSTVDMFAILEKSSLQLQYDRCPAKASFVVPCRGIDTSNKNSGWCEPEPQLGVQLWIKEQTSGSTGSTATKTSSPSSANAGSGNSSSSSSKTIAIVLGILLAVAVVVCVALFVMLRKRKSAENAKEYTEMPVTPPYHEGDSAPRELGGGSFPAKHGGRPSERPSEATTVATGMSGNIGREIELANDSIRKKSAVLTAFCEDQALMMKRIAYARLHFDEPMDKGANGEVWRGRYEAQVVAIKRVRQNENTETGDLKDLEDFAKEITLAAALEHPNIVRFIGLSWRVLSDLSMVSEFMALGDLSRLLESNEGKQMTWGDQKVSIAVDVANALVYLHSLMPLVIHRDLKSRNVLLDEQLTAKISDFGLSRERSLEETMTSGIGTLLWTAPEVLRGERYDEKADMYSFGVVLAELDTCLPPYSLNPEVEGVRSKGMALMPLITRGEVQPAFSPECPPPILELAKQCLDQNPANRPPAMQVVYHLRSKIRPLL